MKSLYIFLFALCSALIGISQADAISCGKIENESGVISLSGTDYYAKCWFIPVPKDKYLRITIDSLKFGSKPCQEAHLGIKVDATNEIRTFCSHHSSSLPKELTFFSKTLVTVLLPPRGRGYSYSMASVNVTYSIRSIICAQSDHFRCSENDCVYQHQVCNGIKDCDNGLDEDGCATGLEAVKGIKLALADVAESLRRSRSSQFGWGESTHRAIVALHLSGNAHFENKSMEEELMVRELEVKLLAAILRNSTDELSVADLSMYVDALIVTCQNPLQFYGHDLLKTLKDRVFHTPRPLPGAILTLCNANSTIPGRVVLNLLKLLQEESDYPFIQDIQASTVMALNCIKRKTISFEEQVSEIINSTNEKFIAGQNSDGSFGTVHSTALITQALLSSDQENNSKWNLTATVKYLMNQLQSSDILGSYLVLPILNHKTLLDVSNSHCIRSRKTRDDAVTDIASKPGKKVSIQFSLFIGDLKDVIHTIHLRLPETSTAYDVMRLAESNDNKFKFSYRYAGDHLYVYRIANVFNDPQSFKFWLLYATSGSNLDEPLQFTTSPDKFTVKNGMHLIMWYRSLPTQTNEIILIDVTTGKPNIKIEQPEDDLDVGNEEEQTDVVTRNILSEDQLHILSGLGLKKGK